jgi:predicted DNA-binding transcriptional regulator AlpA
MTVLELERCLKSMTTISELYEPSAAEHIPQQRRLGVACRHWEEATIRFWEQWKVHPEMWLQAYLQMHQKAACASHNRAWHYNSDLAIQIESQQSCDAQLVPERRSRNGLVVGVPTMHPMGITVLLSKSCPTARNHQAGSAVMNHIGAQLPSHISRCRLFIKRW